MYKTYFVFMCKKNFSLASQNYKVFHLYKCSEGPYLYGWGSWDAEYLHSLAHIKNWCNTLKNINKQKPLQKFPSAPLEVVIPPLKTLGRDSSKTILDNWIPTLLKIKPHLLKIFLSHRKTELCNFIW